MHILVIDDDALAGDMTAAVLDELGHDTTLASGAQQALAALAEQPDIELLVCDLHMPGMDGIMLFRQLRADGSSRPFILLTGDDPEQALRVEPALDACVRKDVTIEERLEQALRQWQTRTTR